MKELPEGGLPKPDLLVSTTSACDTHMKWFQVASRIYNAPFYVLDTPYNIGGGDSDHLDKEHVEYYKIQLNDLFGFLEKQTGTSFDKYKLGQTLALSNWTSKLWTEIQDLRKNIPCPMDARDAFSAVYFMLSTPGSQEAVDFYTQLRDELRERVKDGIGTVEDERFRLVWDNLPPWYNLRIFEHLNTLGAVVVAEVFSHTWTGNLDSENPYESLARKYLPNMANSTAQRRVNIILNLVKDFHVNGVILPTNWGCRMMSIGETIVRDTVYKKLGVQSLILDLDSSDPRVAGETQVKERLATFLETLKP
jgi:benzoyl-CoA reductase/2-hydroxyglutaryl-CoA dehydratase subunit BcrC/BadD/HgdB